MKLTTFTDYCLRVLIYLAADPDRRTTIAEIAQSFDISESHLMKVVNFLGKKGWVATVRGKGGGITLGALADSIVIGDVVRQTEGAPVPAACFDMNAGHCSIAKVCRLRGVLGEAVRAFLGVLDRYTLADLVVNRDALAPILFIPGPIAGQAPRLAS
jgi:Rrf2 family nitric oxide-sensitive transcriptional repressor